MCRLYEKIIGFSRVLYSVDVGLDIHVVGGRTMIVWLILNPNLEFFL